MDDLIRFTIDKREFGFDLSIVKQVTWAVEVTPLPIMNAQMIGMINYHGRLIPVVNMRKVFGIREKEIEMTDQFIICQFHEKWMALWVDNVEGVINEEKEITKMQELRKDILGSSVKIGQNIAFIFNVEYVLSSIESNSKIMIGE